MHRQDRDPVTDASDGSYAVAAVLIIVLMFAALVAAKLLGWA